MSNTNEKMLELYYQGKGYKAIAKELNISENTAKSFCRRQASKSVCKQCGAQIQSKPGRKKKQFCSDKCRLAWWNSHRDKVNRKAFYTITCKHCNQEFLSYADPGRVYCSRECYFNDRRMR